jgi:DNA-binding NtrC family response regulator
VEHFLAQLNKDNGRQIRGVTPQAMQTLVNFHWPGNVRELQNIIERAATFAKNDTIEAHDIHLDAGPAKGSVEKSGFLPPGMTLDNWEDEMIREALRRANGNKSQAARLLGLTRNALRYRLSKIGIPDDPESPE